MSDGIQKSFWQKPEGKVGTLALPLVLGAGGLVAWAYVVPFVVSMLANTALAMLLGLGIVSVSMFLWGNRAALWYLYKRASYVGTNLIYTIDPIGVLRVSAANTLERAKGMAEIRKQLREQISITNTTIAANERERKANATAAQSSAKWESFVKGRQAGRLQDSNVTLKEFLSKIQGMDKVLELYINITNALGKDMELEANEQEKNRKILLRGHKLLGAAAKQLRGQEEALEQFNRGVEYLVNERREKLGEIENFADVITEAVKNMDMEKGIFDADAMNQFEVWEKKADTLLLSAGKENELQQAIAATPQLTTANASVSRTTYTDLFDRKR
jgi:hypothetical protein